MEHEIMGHTKKAYKIWKKPGQPLPEKFKEIIVEVLIIVFAVSFAAFIERTREHYKEKSEAKEFVLGLRDDIKDEINLLNGDVSDIDTLKKNFSTIMKLKSADIDSLQKRHVKGIYNISTFNSRIVNGRYDGFKSSGKIQTIENDSLRNDILKFYQQDIPAVDFVESNLNQNQDRLEEFLINSSDSQGTKPTDIVKLLASTKGKLILEFSIGYANSLNDSYDVALKQAKKIEAEINEEYK